MADFLLNLHREKNFVQLLIEGVDERITIEYIERLMAPLDEIIFTKVPSRQFLAAWLKWFQDNPKWHYTKRDITIPPLQLTNLSMFLCLQEFAVSAYVFAGTDMYNSELKSELQRQASEREMILVKQQQVSATQRVALY